jgi:hypothetical protein
VRAGAVETLCVGLMAFTVAGGMLVAANRFMFPANAVSDRFLTWTTLFWIGALCAIVHLGRERPWGGWFAIALLGLVAACMVASLQQARRLQFNVRQNLARDAAMHLSGVRWDHLARVGIKKDPETVYRVAGRLRRERRSFFADGRGALSGMPLRERFAATVEDGCAGAVERLEEVDARDGPAAMVSGRLRPSAGAGVPSYLVIADSAAIIRGVGAIRPLPDDVRSEGVGWIGFVDGFDASEPYTAYGVLGDGRSVCTAATWSGEAVKRR